MSRPPSRRSPGRGGTEACPQDCCWNSWRNATQIPSNDRADYEGTFASSMNSALPSGGIDVECQHGHEAASALALAAMTDMTDNGVQPFVSQMHSVEDGRTTKGQGPSENGKARGRTAIDFVRVDPAVLRVLDDSVLLDRRRDLRRERLRTHRQSLAAVAPCGQEQALKPAREPAPSAKAEGSTRAGVAMGAGGISYAGQGCAAARRAAAATPPRRHSPARGSDTLSRRPTAGTRT